MAETLKMQKTHAEESKFESIKAPPSIAVTANLGIEAYRKGETEKTGKLERFTNRIKEGVHHISEIKRSQVITIAAAAGFVALGGGLVAGAVGRSVAEAIATWYMSASALGSLSALGAEIGTAIGAVMGLLLERQLP